MPREWSQGFKLLNRKVFSWLLKVSKDAVSLKSLGSEFHVLGPQKEKDLSPIILNFNQGVTYILESDDDLRWRELVTPNYSTLISISWLIQLTSYSYYFSLVTP